MKNLKGSAKKVNVNKVNNVKEVKDVNNAILLKEKESALNDALKVNDNDIANLINEGNINEALKSFTSLRKKGSKESTLYKDAIYNTLNVKEKKSLRMKLRRIRNNFAKDIIKSKEDKETLKTLITSFNTFYTSFYKVNDLTFHSLSAKNNDDDTFILINDMLNIIKDNKIK